MLCYDGRLRKGSLASQFFLLSSTTTSSATGGYVVVPERLSRNGKPTSGNELFNGNEDKLGTFLNFI